MSCKHCPVDIGYSASIILLSRPTSCPHTSMMSTKFSSHKTYQCTDIYACSIDNAPRYLTVFSPSFMS